MARGKPQKEFHEYIIEASGSHVRHKDYLESPASAFLKYTVEAKDAVNYCQKHFHKNGDGSYSKDALDSLQHIMSAFLPALMGHFETYQRYLFAGLFERSSLLQKFNIDKFFRSLTEDTALRIDPVRLSAYRGFGTSIGVLLADHLPGWHNPDKVNQYFRAFDLQAQFFSNKDCRRLRTLWQLRHSIVHTGGTITIPDAQKVDDLMQFGDEPVVFDKQFILEVSRKMHPLVRDATDRLAKKFRGRLLNDVSEEDRKVVDKLFEVRSPVAVWLK